MSKLHKFLVKLPFRIWLRNRMYWPVVGTLLYAKNLSFKKKWRLCLAFILKNGIIPVRLQPFEFPILVRSGTSDVPLFYQIFLRKDYDVTFDYPTFIIDGGANVGYTSIFFAQKFPLAKVVAIEPEKSNFLMLEKNTSFYDNIIPIRAGIWNKKTSLGIKNFSLGNHWGAQVTESKDSDFSSITITDVLKKFRRKKIDILKLDVEGAEETIFSSNYSWLSNVRMLIIELHEWIHPGSPKFHQAIQKYKFKKSSKQKNLIFEKV